LVLNYTGKKATKKERTASIDQAIKAKNSAVTMLNKVLTLGKEAQAKLVVKKGHSEKAKRQLATSRYYAKILRNAIRHGKRYINGLYKKIQDAKKGYKREVKRERDSRTKMHRYVGHLDREMKREFSVAKKAAQLTIYEPLAKMTEEETQIQLGLSNLAYEVVKLNSQPTGFVTVNKKHYDAIYTSMKVRTLSSLATYSIYIYIITTKLKIL